MKFALILLLIASNAVACSVPVFRYALEHWAPDPYQVEVAHSKPLTEEQTALVKQLQEAKQVNITVKEMVSKDDSPRLVVKHPASMRSGREVWNVPLTEDNVDQLLDSPMREEISESLGDGESAMWVLLESGNKVADDAAFEMLEKQLEHQSETMALPQLDDQDIKNGLVSVPDDGLRLSFQVLRLSRDDEDETFLAHMLMSTEADLPQLKGQPMAFPIFGRGRVLYALVGKGIEPNNIAQAVKFLIGSCSCQIKEQNPGVDLVINANWAALLKADKLLDEKLPTLDDIDGLKPVLVPIPEHVAKQPAVVTHTLDSSWMGVIFGGVLVVAFVVLLLRRDSSNANV